MHLFARASLKNRALIALVTIVAAVFGVIGVGQLKQELMPPVEFPVIAVVTSYPGATPEVVNADVTVPVETALRGVPNLVQTSGTSSTNSSVVIAEFDYGVDIASTEQKTERAISRLGDQIPETADWQVISGSIDDFPVIQIAVTPGDGEDAESAAERLRSVLVPELEDIDGVREAAIQGARGDRVSITLDEDALAERQLGASDVKQVLQQNGMLMPAGQITEGEQTLAVQAGSKLSTIEQIQALPVVPSPETIQAQQAQAEAQQPGAAALPGADAFESPEPQPLEVVTLGDVAAVELVKNPETGLSRVNGEPALTLGVTKISTANTVEVSQAVRAVIDEQQDALEGATLTVVFDQAPYIEQSIETLTSEGLLGLLFAVLVIFVFLFSVRSTLVTAISIPTSILLALIAVWLTDYSLNLLTLGALTVSIGRVVDDSIVVIENIQRHLRPGVDRFKTIVFAVKEVASAITASTVATIAVFLPLAFVGGVVGELFGPFAFTVSFALAASLLVSLTIVPVLASWFIHPKADQAEAGGVAGADGIDESARDELAAGKAALENPTKLQKTYLPVIHWTLKRPMVTLLIAALVFVGTIAATPFMKTNFLGEDEQNSVLLTQTVEPSLSLETELELAKTVESALADVEEIETLQVSIGQAGGGAVAFGGGEGEISYAITTDTEADQARVKDEIRAAVADLEGEFSIGSGGGGIQNSTVEIVVTAPDNSTLAEANDAVLAAVKAKDVFAEVESSLATSRPYLAITVKRDEAAKAGLSEAAVAGMVANVMSPSQIGNVEVNDRTVAVYLTETAPPADAAAIRATTVPTVLGEKRVDELATVEQANGPVAVQTGNGVRQAVISALPEGDDLGVASAAVREALDEVKLAGGAKAEIGGVLSEQNEAFGQMGLALLAAILIVYVIMVATFKSLLQPLLLLVSVPFAATGAILLLIATGIPLGVPSLIGVLMLVGIVVTNAIVLVDLVNQYRERGMPLRQAVEAGATYRYRPIIMTALATILALVPMGVGITGKSGFISQPLAIVVIGGLISSTAMTLIVLPTLYYRIERGRERRRERRSARRRQRDREGADLSVAAASEPGFQSGSERGSDV